MATPMIGYDVSYERKAFRTKIDSEGIHITALELLLERVAKFVQEQSDGRWIISNKVVVMPSDRTKPVELTVIVPAGTDQYEQYLAAVGLFESRVAAWLTDYPFDTSLRTIETNGPKCQMCSNKAEWVRRTQFSGNHLFCKLHAEAEEDFGDNSSNNMFWEQLEPVTT